MRQPLIYSTPPRSPVEAWLEGLLPPLDYDSFTESAAKPAHQRCHKRFAMISPGSPRKRIRTSPEPNLESFQSSESVTMISRVAQTTTIRDSGIEEGLGATQSPGESLAHRSRSSQRTQNTRLGFPSFLETASFHLPGQESPFSNPPPLSPTRSETSTTTARTGATNRSRRPKSPVKTTADLFLAAKPFEYTEDMELPGSLESLRDAKDDIETVPAIIKVSIFLGCYG